MIYKDQLEAKAKYLDSICDEIPCGLYTLKDAVSFACIELRLYLRLGTKTESWPRLIAFIDTIPVCEDLNSPELTNWMLHSEDHLKYMPL